MHTLIVTFYAYKGGTGRTLALSNVARYLADELGYRIGLVDLDLESPGLVHEPLCTVLEQTDEAKKDLLKSIDTRDGFIECFLERASTQGQPTRTINDYVCVLSSGRNGGIVLMPAACGSVSKEGVYSDAVNRFVTALAPESIPSTERADRINLASEITWKILREFAEEYQLDCLFIDGRTGAGPFFSPVYMYSVPHLLVLFSGLNDQNILGSLATLQATDDGATDQVPVLLVVSPVPTVGPAELERRLGFITTRLAEERERRIKNVDAKYRYRLPRNVDHFLPYSDAASFREVYFPGRYPNSLLAKAYRSLALRIANLVIRPKESEVPTSPSKTSALVAAKPIRMAIENVHADVLKFDDVEIALEPYGSENKTAPWERLMAVNDGDAIEDLLSDMPDIVAIPQTHLHALTAKCDGKLLYDVNGLRKEFGASPALDLEFLDRYYLNWRHWCSTEKTLAGLPFSVNAMLLCADANKLSPICKLYWDDRGQSPADPFFLPSSWESLVTLLQVGIRNGVDRNEIFRIVSGNRGLYYDWLNFTASMGGFDLIQSEGLTQEVVVDRKETIDATRRFVELARLCGTSCTMDAQVRAFDGGELAMYVGWTDSFRFHRDGDGGALSGVSVTRLKTVENKEQSNQRIKDVRLGHSPRDMRHSRKTLVDGWVMAFPRKTGREHMIRALTFAGKFLDPANQRRLLRAGFPSPSAWAIEQEIEELRADRTAASNVDAFEPNRDGGRSDTTARKKAERSFKVFLETMKLAIHSGRWIASPKTNISIEDAISGALRSLIRDDADINATMIELAQSFVTEPTTGRSGEAN